MEPIRATASGRFDLSQSIADCRIRSVMVAPLLGRANTKPLGVIQLDTQAHNKKFTQDDLKLLKWSDDALDGKGYVDWYPFVHPQLGPVELGGWNEFYAFSNPPSQFLERELAKFPRWLIWHLLISPQLELFEASAAPLGEGAYRVRLAVQNSGWLPTYVMKSALDNKLVRGVVCEIELPEGASLASGHTRQVLGQVEGRAYKPSSPFGWDVGDPTTMSSCPLYRLSSTANAESNVMYRVAWFAWLSCFTAFTCWLDSVALQ